MYSKKTYNHILSLFFIEKKSQQLNSFRFTKTSPAFFRFPVTTQFWVQPTRSPGRDLSILGVDPIFGQIPWRQQKCRPDSAVFDPWQVEKNTFSDPQGGWNMVEMRNAFRMVKGLYLSHVRFHVSCWWFTDSANGDSPAEKTFWGFLIFSGKNKVLNFYFMAIGLSKFRNPAIHQYMENLPLFTGFYLSQLVVWDFFHQHPDLEDWDPLST